MSNFLKSTVFALTVAVASTSVHAGENGKSIVVSYADLDLSGQAGRTSFDRRIERAIAQVCGELEGRPTFDGSVRRCHLETRISAHRSRDLAVQSFSHRIARGEERRIHFAAR